jgi:inner membrane protein
MPSIITHAVVPLIVGGVMGRRHISARLLIMGAVLAALPDADVISFKLGIAYTDTWGHRGAAHSIAFALTISCLASVFYKSLHTSLGRCIGFLFLAAVSHPLLDACTDGGLGVALFWPFSELRWFMPFRPIEVSPIGLTQFLSQRGWAVLQSEILWVWLPTLGLAAVLLAGRWIWPAKYSRALATDMIPLQGRGNQK